MLKLGLLNADLDVRGMAAIEEVKLFRLTESEKRDFESRLPEMSALVADLNLINIDSFKFLRGFSEQLTERVREGSLLLCFTSRPNLHSPDGIQNKYSWLPLFDPAKEVREDLVDKIKTGEGANGVSTAFHGLISSFYATCSFPEGFGSEPYNTLLQGDDGLPVGLAKPLGKGWVLLIPQAEEKSKVLESALNWWNERLSNPESEEPLAAMDETDSAVDTSAADDEALGEEPLDLGDISASPEASAEADAAPEPSTEPEFETADEPAPSMDDFELDTAASSALESASGDEFEVESTEAAPDESAGEEPADLGALEASAEEADAGNETPEVAEDMDALLASPPPEEDEFGAMSAEPVDFDLDAPGAEGDAAADLNSLLETPAADETDESEQAASDESPEPVEDPAAAARRSIESIDVEEPMGPSWLEEFKAEVPGLSDIAEEAEKLESEARRLLDQAGELRGRIDALSRWDRLLYLSHADIAEELGEFFHVVLGADVSIEEERDEGRPTLKMLSAEGDFLVHVATDEKPVGEEIGRDLMRHLADADVDTKGLLVVNGSQGRNPPRSPEDHAQKKLVKLASKRGLLIVTVYQLYRLGLKAQQDENWNAEPVLEQLAEQSGIFELKE